MKIRSSLIVIILTLTMLTAMSYADETPSSATTTPADATTTVDATGTKEKQVLQDLHHSNQMEIEMGAMARTKGASEGVRDFGAKLVKDHTDADARVMKMARQRNIDLSGQDLAPTHQEHGVMDKLQNRSGSEFDRAFAKAMVDDHKKDIKQLTAAEKDLTGTPVGNLIAELLPVLQSHEQIAEGLVTDLQKAQRPS